MSSNLSRIDNQSLDGLTFCHRVYKVFDCVAQQPDGVARLRLRNDRDDKRLVEELLPLTRYILARYQEGRRLKVRWQNGSQPYDAILCSSGSLVEHGGAPEQVFVEITTAVHRNDRWRREELQSSGGSFGVKNILKKSGIVVSQPHVYSGGENARDLAAQIVDAINRKTTMRYPFDTVLIISCVPDCLILKDEWKEALESVKKSVIIRFREVFVLEMLGSHTTTLYGVRDEHAADACS